MNDDFEKIYETACAGSGGGSSIAAVAPEHTINIVNGQEEKQLKEAMVPYSDEDLNTVDADGSQWESFIAENPDFEEQDFSGLDDGPFVDEEEIAQEAMWNSIPDPTYPGDEDYHMTERLELRKQLNQLREEEKPDYDEINKVRYSLQKFTNGGTPYIDENGVSQVDGEQGGPSSYEAWRGGINNKKRDARLKLEKEEKETPFASPKHTNINFKTIDGQRDDFLQWWVEKFGDEGANK